MKTSGSSVAISNGSLNALFPFKHYISHSFDLIFAESRIAAGATFFLLILYSKRRNWIPFQTIPESRNLMIKKAGSLILSRTLCAKFDFRICSFWAREQPKYDRIFSDLQPVNGKVSGSSAKNEMVKSKLPNSVGFFDFLRAHFRSNNINAYVVNFQLR